MKKLNIDLRNLIWIALAFIYILVRFVFTRQLDTLGEFASYYFEVICIVIAILICGKKIISFFNLKRTASYAMVLSLITGFGIFKLASFLQIIMPLDLKNLITVVFLLLIAPVLEELIFRFLLWQPIQILIKKPYLTLALTSLIFSYSHLHAIWFVPTEYHQFIILQTTYTLFLGLTCGFYIYRYSSLSSAIFIHFAFNLGFFAASFT